MNARNINYWGYWTATTLVALAFLTGGAAYLSRADFAVGGLAELGYPAHFVTILGAWKVLGGLAILAPGLPRLKEWAYAGIAFDLTGAALSHAAIGHPAVKAIVPLVILGIAAASWALRPASRRLAGPTGEGASASRERAFRKTWSA
jgi:DoxX-like family